MARQISIQPNPLQDTGISRRTSFWWERLTPKTTDTAVEDTPKHTILESERWDQLKRPYRVNVGDWDPDEWNNHKQDARGGELVKPDGRDREEDPDSEKHWSKTDIDWETLKGRRPWPCWTEVMPKGDPSFSSWEAQEVLVGKPKREKKREYHIKGAQMSGIWRP